MQLPSARRLLVNPSREEMSQAEVTWGLLHCSAIRMKYLRSFMSKDHWEALGLFRALCWGSCPKKRHWICHSPQVETPLDRLQGQGCSTAGRRAGAPRLCVTFCTAHMKQLRTISFLPTASRKTSIYTSLGYSPRDFKSAAPVLIFLAGCWRLRDSRWASFVTHQQISVVRFASPGEHQTTLSLK